VGKKWFSCSIEEVIRRSPDIIVYLSMEEESSYLWERLQNIRAVQENNILRIDDTVAGSPTPEAFVSAVETLHAFLWKDAEEQNVP
jgi:ABC-type Fe3+-hydroxamate transport system substrate-binding protein